MYVGSFTFCPEMPNFPHALYKEHGSVSPGSSSVRWSRWKKLGFVPAYIHTEDVYTLLLDFVVKYKVRY